MRLRPAAACAIAVLIAAPASAHRLDEYLQAAKIVVERGRILIEMRLAPGLDVLPVVVGAIDRDRDGSLSPAEREAYAQRVLHEVTLSVDGAALPLRLRAALFPDAELLQAGRGEIELRAEADVPGSRRSRTLTFVNRHQPAVSVYLANAVVPRDAGITLVSQERNYTQSFYRLDYAEAGETTGVQSFPWPLQGWAGGAGLVLASGVVVAARRYRRSPHR